MICISEDPLFVGRNIPLVLQGKRDFIQSLHQAIAAKIIDLKEVHVL